MKNLIICFAITCMILGCTTNQGNVDHKSSKVTFNVSSEVFKSAEMTVIAREVGFSKCLDLLNTLDTVDLVISDGIDSMNYAVTNSDFTDTTHYGWVIEYNNFILNNVSSETLKELDSTLVYIHQNIMVHEGIDSMNVNIKDMKYVFVANNFLKTLDKRYERLLTAINAYCQGNPDCGDYRRDIVNRAIEYCDNCEPLKDYSSD